ncbi:MAG: hypothetical protein B7Z53_02235 [Rhodospirillales bacterium 12-71-4]|nr:MAG: hypothetical protein B7Z53_02235 [Rhodospirillales bacterium 12-71-4]
MLPLACQDGAPGAGLREPGGAAPRAPAQARLRLATRGWFAWLAALLLAAAALLGSETLLARLAADRAGRAAGEADAAATIAHQIVLRRLEAVDVLHRLTQTRHDLMAQADHLGQQAIEAELARTANEGQFGFIQVAVIDRAGWLTWSSVPGFSRRLLLADREHFRVHAEGLDALFASVPVLGRASNRWTVQFTRPLKSGPAFDGVVVVSMDLLNLSEELNEIRFRAEDQVQVLRGAVGVASSDEAGSGIGTRLAPEDPRLALPDGPGRGTFFRPAGPGRAPAVIGWRRSADTPFLVTYVLDQSAAEAAFARLALLVRLAAGGAGLIAVLLVALGHASRARGEARRDAERAETERRLSAAAQAAYVRRIDGLPAMIYGGRIGPDGHLDLTHVSDSAERVIGWGAGQVLTMADRQLLFDPDGGPTRRDLYAEVARSGQALSEQRLRRQDGSWIWVRDSLRVVDRAPDGTAEVIGYMADITEERRIRAGLQSTGRLTTLGEMATGLAHELNQPLAVMSLAADNATRALRRNGAAALPAVEERLARIGVQAQRARAIVDHLRVFGRQDEGEAEAVSLASAVEGARVLAAGALREAGVALRVDLPEDLPPVIARLIPLEQALVNLLLNARDAIRSHHAEGAAPSLVVIRAAAGPACPGMVRVAVSDTGGGISPEVMERLFEPFFTTKPPGQGTGLGLSLCHATMKSFGGGISAANDPEGAVFTLTFRQATAALDMAESAVEAA